MSGKNGAEDTGHAWMIVIASFFSHLLVYGITWSSGIFYIIILHNIPNEGSAQVGFVVSLNSGMNYGSAAVAGILCNKYGCRFVAILGGFMTGMGLVLSSFSANVTHLCFTFGILTGCGQGFAVVPAITIVGLSFKKNRSIAYGIAVAGTGVGTFVLPPLIQHLEEAYGWSSAFLLSGGVTFNLLVSAALFKPQTATNEQESLQHSPITKLYLCLFKDCSFVAVCVHNIFIWMGLTTVYMHLPAYAIHLGFTENQAARLISIVGILNLLGRLAFAALVNLESLTSMCLYTLGFLLCGGCVVLSCVINQYVWLGICAGVFGFSSAVFGPLYPLILIQILDLEQFTVGFGYAMSFMAFGTLSAGPLSGVLLEVTGYYPSTLYLGGLSLAVGSLIMLIPWKCLGKRDMTIALPVNRVNLNDNGL